MGGLALQAGLVALEAYVCSGFVGVAGFCIYRFWFLWEECIVG